MSLSDWGSWASLIGLAFTFFTFLAVLTIRRKLTLRHSAVDSHQSLKAHALRLTEHSRNFDSRKTEIKNDLALARVDLKIPPGITDEELQKEIQATTALISRYLDDMTRQVPFQNSDRLWEIITGINVIVATMEKTQRTQFVKGT